MALAPEDLRSDISGAARVLPHGWVTALLALTSFVGSALLFSVEPMIARMLLPELGGSPAVWNTALVFFQVALLAGYAFAHVALGRMTLGRAMLLEVVAFSAAAVVLPVGLPGGWEPPTTGSPTAWTLLVLTAGIGAPFIVLSTLSPTLQHWLASTSHPDAHDPYFLYGAGNAGSLAALVSYPLLVEPSLGLQAQARLWSWGFALTIALTVACAATTWRRRSDRHQLVAGSDAVPPTLPASPLQRLHWLALAAVPSALLAGVTRHLATDVASVPMLWVAPLCLYLTTFIAAFGRRSVAWTRLGTAAARPLAILAVLDALATILSPLPGLLLHLAAFASIAMAAHGRLAATRPPARQLTGYYLVLSLGGVAGSALAVLVAPLVFDSVLEYPLAVLAAVLLLPASSSLAGRGLRPSRGTLAGGALAVVAIVGARRLGTDAAAIAALCALAAGGAAIMRRWPTAALALMSALALVLLRADRTGQVYAERTFFGVSRVQETAQFRELISGTTMHGRQALDDPEGRRPLAYYSEESPISQVLDATRRRPAGPLDMGVIGLGAGSLAAYGETGDRFTFYEIDPAVIRIAQDPELFGFVTSSAADVGVVLGDGRKLVEQADGVVHRLLVIDAFSSDSIPVHLLTREALDTYQRRLTADGVIAVHVSNRFFDLVPVLAALADDRGWEARVNRWDPPADAPAGAASTVWVVLTVPGPFLDALGQDPAWTTPAPHGDVWTDDHADLLATLDVTG